MSIKSNKTCTIYVLTNKVNNKIYIGQTWQKTKDRFNNGNGYKRSSIIHNAIKKHGIENFEYTVLKNCETQKDADYWEEFYILSLDSVNTKKGYNIKKGGSNGRHSEETKIKMSIAHKGKKPSELCQINSIKSRKGSKASLETRKKQSDAKKGKPSPHIGKKRSQEVCKKISIANTGRKHTAESKRNMSLSRIGRVLTLETRKKISKSRIGKKASLETRKKLSKSHIGIKHSEETKKKISLSKVGKFKLNTEQIKNVLKDIDSSRNVAKKYNVSHNTILKIRKDKKYQKWNIQ